MMGGAPGEHPAREHTQRVHGKKAGQRHVGDGDRRRMQRTQRHHQIGVEPAVHDRRQHEIAKIEQDRQREDDAPSGGRIGASLGGCVGGLRNFALRLGLGDQRQQDDEAENRGAHIGAAPTEIGLHGEQRRRRDGRADDAGEGMECKDLAEPLLRRVVRQAANNRKGERRYCPVRRGRTWRQTPSRSSRSRQSRRRRWRPPGRQSARMRAPIRSTRNPIGVCSTPETTLKTVSASASSV